MSHRIPTWGSRGNWDWSRISSPGPGPYVPLPHCLLVQNHLSSGSSGAKDESSRTCRWSHLALPLLAPDQICLCQHLWMTYMPLWLMSSACLTTQSHSRLPPQSLRKSSAKSRPPAPWSFPRLPGPWNWRESLLMTPKHVLESPRPCCGRLLFKSSVWSRERRDDADWH